MAIAKENPPTARPAGWYPLGKNARALKPFNNPWQGDLAVGTPWCMASFLKKYKHL